MCLRAAGSAGATRNPAKQITVRRALNRHREILAPFLTGKSKHKIGRSCPMRGREADREKEARYDEWQPEISLNFERRVELMGWRTKVWSIKLS